MNMNFFIAYASVLFIASLPALGEQTQREKLRDAAESTIVRIKLRGEGPPELKEGSITVYVPPRIGDGTGVIISPNGAALTARHVVGNDDEFDRSETTGEITGRKLFVSAFRRKGPLWTHPKPVSAVTLSNDLDAAVIHLPVQETDFPYVNKLNCDAPEGKSIFVMPWRTEGEPDYIAQPAIIEGKIGVQTVDDPRVVWISLELPLYPKDSGSAVFDSDSRLVGIVIQRDTGAPSRALMIRVKQFAKLFFNEAGAPTCEPSLSHVTGRDAAVFKFFDLPYGSPVIQADVRIYEDDARRKLIHEGKTDQNGQFALKAYRPKIFVEAYDANHETLFEGFDLKEGEKNFVEIPLMNKKLETCRVATISALKNSVIVGDFKAPKNGGLEELAARITDALNYDLSTELQKYNISAFSKPKFKTCATASFPVTALSKLTAKNLGVDSLIWGDVTAVDARDLYQFNTFIMDAHDLIQDPYLIKNYANLADLTHSKIEPKTRLLVLGALVAALVSENRCVEVITVMGLMEEMRILDTDKPIAEKLRSFRLHCQKQLPQFNIIVER